MDYDDFDVHFTGLSSYHSPGQEPGMLARLAPSPTFYTRMLWTTVLRLFFLARVGKCTDEAWVVASSTVARQLEATGCTLHVEGMENIRAVDGPCIFVGNHMSTLETFILPSIIRPHRPVTFVVKRSLTTMPFFGPVMRSRNPVVVDRKSPRQDLQTVMEEGCRRLESGVSLVVFPQSTRSVEFDQSHFNSIGVKLAKRSGRPIVPLALLTHAWTQGKYLHDFGPIKPERPIRFLFGAPITVTDQGKAEHAHICRFISETLQRWQQEE